MLHYTIPDFSGVDEFLGLLARRQGKLKKGGMPNVDKAARGMLMDWNSGRITFYTHPPEQHMLPTHIDAAIVSEMGKAFDFGLLEQEDKETLGGKLSDVKFFCTNNLFPLLKCTVKFMSSF